MLVGSPNAVNQLRTEVNAQGVKIRHVLGTRNQFLL